MARSSFFTVLAVVKSGDVFTFLVEIEGRTFVEVARDLARRSGIDLPETPRSPQAVRQLRAVEDERSKLIRLHKLAQEYFTAQFASENGKAARDYVAGRGIGAQTIALFGVGYAPSGWEGLVRFFESKNVPHELAEKSGLIRRRESAKLAANAPPTKATHFDFFVNRVVYALTSPMGEIIGFGGRVINPEDQPKYKNSPETHRSYKKGENLFGMHLAKHAIRRTGRALVVEGNFDVMTLHQSASTTRWRRRARR